MSSPQDDQPSAPPEGYIPARESAAVFDVSARTRLVMTGADRRNFLHNFCTNEIRGLVDGSSCEAFLLNVKGRILAHILVSAEEDDRLWIGSVPGQASPITEHLEKYHLLEDFQLSDCSGETGEFLVTGPDGGKLLGEAGIDVSSLAVFQNRRVALTGVEQVSDVFIQRFDMLGSPGYLLTTSGPGSGLAEHLTLRGIAEGAPAAFESLRVEAGFPVYGTDLSVDNLAQEACRTDATISFTKGCYLGQEPVARIHALGHVNRELRVLEIRGEATPPTGTALLNPKNPEKEIGQLSSVSWSWQQGCAVGIALVRSQFASAGTELPIGGDPTSTAIVVEPPRSQR
jgi:tRNA-modifying protein YgfZ